MKENEIRPKNIFIEYLRLAELDTKKYFSNVTKNKINCPACKLPGQFSFNKHGFDYDECQHCFSLYVNPRPEAEAFSEYYLDSLSSKYWATTFYKETAAARKEKIWKPKAKLICELMERYAAGSSTIVDIGGGYGLFAEEIRNLVSNEVIVIEPAPHLAEKCREKSLPVIQKFLEEIELKDLPDTSKLLVSFELFEHLHDPEIFMNNLSKIMTVDDLFVFTTLSGTGLDIQVLWENSQAVSPPHHLNFLNPDSITLLLERAGFDCLEVTTPGKLDLDILENNKQFIHDKFWKSFLQSTSEKVKSDWQTMISNSGKSSHMMVVCRKSQTL
jgi:SAM-dependent methyltransferase